jgi:hypothetical protein
LWDFEKIDKENNIYIAELIGHNTQILRELDFFKLENDEQKIQIGRMEMESINTIDQLRGE